MSLAVLVASVVLGIGMFALSRHANQRDETRLLTSQAQDARTTITATIGEIDSTLSSLGYVADATNGDPDAFTRLAATDPAMQIFPALTVLHQAPDGAIETTVQIGVPSEPLVGLHGQPGARLSDVIAHGGSSIVGLFGTGKQRRLALAEGAPFVPGGYIIYAEVPLPANTTVPSGFPNLEYALYFGQPPSGQVLLASTHALPLRGQRVVQKVDLSDLTTSTNTSKGNLVFVVEAHGSLIGTLSDLLPWILGAVALVFGLLVAFVVEVTGRRKDQALTLVDDLERRTPRSIMRWPSR